MKPRVMSLVVFTALVGLVLAPAPIHPLTALTALICIAAGASGANHRKMPRLDRPCRVVTEQIFFLNNGRLARSRVITQQDGSTA